MKLSLFWDLVTKFREKILRTTILPAQRNSCPDFSPDVDVLRFDRQSGSPGELLETKTMIPRSDKGIAIIIF